MRAPFDRRTIAIALVVAFVGFLAAAPVVASTGGQAEFRLTAQIPEAADWAEIPSVADELDYDPLFDEDFDFSTEPEVSDPFERTNRVMLTFNRGVDRFFLDPFTTGYRFIVPEIARRGIRRVFLNLNSPAVLANDLLQFRFVDAGTTLGRFLVNTTVGLGGMIDVGERLGMERHSADFGQTLARRGVGAGPYLMLPIFGPNTLRDGLGNLVDLLFQPLTYLIGPAPNLMIGTGRGLAALEAATDAKKALEEGSVDYYAALRSAYMQNRQAHVREDGDLEEKSELDRPLEDRDVELEVELDAAQNEGGS